MSSAPLQPSDAPVRSDQTDPSDPACTGLFAREQRLVIELAALWQQHNEQVNQSLAHYERQLQFIEDTYAQQQDLAAAELKKRTEKAQSELASALTQYDTQHQQAIDLHTKTWQSRLDALNEQFELETEQANTDAREAIWLAETVYESSRPRPDKDFAVAREKIKAQRSSASKSEQLASELWPKVALPTPHEDPQPTSSDSTTCPSLADCIASIEHTLHRLDALRLPRFYRQGYHLVVYPALVIAAAGAAGFLTHWSNIPVLAGVAGVATVLVVALGFHLSRKARASFVSHMQAFSAQLDEATLAARRELEHAEKTRDEQVRAITAQRDTEIANTNERLAATLDRLNASYQSQLADLQARQQHELDEINRIDAQLRHDTQQKVDDYLAQARASHESAMTQATSIYQQTLDELNTSFEAAQSQLAADFNTRSHALKAELDDILATARSLCPPWETRLDHSWQPTLDAPFGIAVASLSIPLDALLNPSSRADSSDSSSDPAADHALQSDLSSLVDEALSREDIHARAVARQCSPRTLFPDPITLPLLIEPASRGSYLIEATPALRDQAIDLLRAAILRLLATAPPGRAKLTIFDPVGRGQSFAGLMRLADHDESLAGSRIWTESRHMEQQLTNLTEHIENVIQKYLRDEFDSIDEYNRIAGEIAEPYRYLVVADFPTNFSDDAAARLASIIDAGARCGVHVIMLVDPNAQLPRGFSLEKLRQRAIVLSTDQPGSGTSARLHLTETPFDRAEIVFEASPDESQTTSLLDLVGRQAVAASRVEVNYDILTPPTAADRWSRTCDEELHIPLGRTGATRLQQLSLGRSTSQHVLIAGKTGSGKSNLLHVLATSAMLWYGPDQLELYLVDFKKGVEFKTYATPGLPHIRAVAIESDREFGLSVLQKLDDKLRQRGDLFRAHSVQSLAQFRAKNPTIPMPRTLLIIDEFQEFFVEDDRIAQDASLLLDRLVRQGRAFGMHVLLASQTLSGAYALSRSTMGQMAVRIALRCSETDSYLILSEDNNAARLLNRPGEAIYNDANGLLEGNQPFQIAYLSETQKAATIETIVNHARHHNLNPPPPVLFEGNAPAQLQRNPRLLEAIRTGARPGSPHIWLGAPVSIKDPTSAILRRRNGSNLLVVSQQTHTVTALLIGAALSIAAQHDHSGENAAHLTLLDGLPDDEPTAGVLASLFDSLPHPTTMANHRTLGDALTPLHAALTERQNNPNAAKHPHYLLINGLHWLRALRKKDDEYGFSFGNSSDDTQAVDPPAMLRDILLDGPPLGLFTICWCDTANSLARWFDRASQHEFANRVLTQMSANDSSLLIESTAAARLGLHRALFFDEERGTIEKFRPYAQPSAETLSELISQLSR